MKIKWLVFAVTCFVGLAPGMTQSTRDQPKLVVGVVVDQMRDDFLARFADLYSRDGLMRMKREGFYAANHRFSYMPTTTAPGHASNFTGTTPAVHGIAGNNWYDPRTKNHVYCVEDSGVLPLGVANSTGQMSPKNLKVTTITDELKLFWNDRSKVVGVSIKDRGAILPAGHLADGAFWLSGDLDFVSSSWYFDALPPWVEEFNRRDLPQEYLKRPWDLLLPKSEYRASLPDDNPYEYTFEGEAAPIMPKDLERLAQLNSPYEILATSPFGTTVLFDFARAAIDAMELGRDSVPDFLTLSLSAPDFIGHAYGPRAVETEDAYLRLDRDLASFFDFLDQKVGLDNCLIFLTADHGAAEPGQFSADRGLPGGLFSRSEALQWLDTALATQYPNVLGLIEEVEGNKLFLNRRVLGLAGLRTDEVAAFIAETLTGFPGIYAAYPVRELRMAGNSEFPMVQLRRGLYPDVAGDVVWVLDSGWMRYGSRGTTHGLPYAYDYHVPLLMWGHGVKPGRTMRETHVRDLAPTLSMMLDIPLPSGATGSPVIEAVSE